MNKFVCVLLCTLLTVGCKDDKTNSDNQGPGTGDKTKCIKEEQRQKDR